MIRWVPGYTFRQLAEINGYEGTEEEWLKLINALDMNINNFTLITTNRIPILNNKILLPSVPLGDILYKRMNVYALNNVMVEYTGITILKIQNVIYACLNENSDISGFGEVSYLIKDNT